MVCTDLLGIISCEYQEDKDTNGAGNGSELFQIDEQCQNLEDQKENQTAY